MSNEREFRIKVFHADDPAGSISKIGTIQDICEVNEHLGNLIKAAHPSDYVHIQVIVGHTSIEIHEIF